MLSCDETPITEKTQASTPKTITTQPKPKTETNSKTTPSTLPKTSPRSYNETNIHELDVHVSLQEKKISDPISLSPVHEATRNALKGMVQQHGLLIDNPWALLHALLALGPNAKLPDGSSAVETLFTEHAEQSFQNRLIQFPKSKKQNGKNILIEPHTDLALKVLSEIGVSPSQTYSIQGKSYSFADLFRSSLLETHLDPKKNISSFSSPNDTPWSIQGLSTYLRPGTTWESKGMVMNLENLTSFLMAVVYQETRFMAQAYQNQQKFEKKKQGIFKYTCGGMHLIQALAYAHARGFGNDKSKPIIEEQAVLLYYRFPIELAIYDQLLQAHPQYKQQLLVQRLKFVGHFLETTAKLEIMGFYRPSESMRTMQKGALDQLSLTTEALRKDGVIQDPSKASTDQLALDLIGDGAHAVYGVELISGLRGIRF